MTGKKLAGVLLIPLALAFEGRTAVGAIDSSLKKTLDLPSAPLDVTTTADGQRTFVLLEGGEVRVYGAADELLGTLRVGQKAEQMSASASGEQLYVTFRDEKRLKIVTVDFRYDIDVSGSPFKGPAGAPVVLAEYSDFQ